MDMCRACFIGILILLLAAPAAAQDDIRVRLFAAEAPQVLHISPEGGNVSFFAGDGGHPLAELRSHENVTIQRRGDEVYVQTDDLAFFALDLRLVPDEAAQLEVAVVDGDAPVDARTYTGELTVRVDEAAHPMLYVVNRLPLEAYVAAVVAREYGFDDLEGAKAMAVLARTHAVRRLGSEAAYDAIDNVLDQQYDGAGRLTPAAREAARLTSGQILTYQDAPIEAVYFAASGGHTADNDAVWDGQPLPYLRGRPDPYDTAHRGWTATVPRDALLRVLSRTYGFEVGGFYLGDPGRDHRVHTIELLHPDLSTAQEIRSNDFRLLINRHFGRNLIKSTMFDARRDGDRYVFTGDGFGHGVGLSQYGALALSRQGYDYRAILDYYFDGVELAHLDGIDLPAAAPPAFVSQTPSPQQQPETPEKKRASGRRVGW